ncbi:MAG TPA: AAA family ATPase [Pyrinomonadaceae bacterium]|nr:AAA family ATPase [Pyrinomonadaceae bacterium]
MSRIFISYRREDSADVTGRIYDHLVAAFGRENVFKDVDAIPYGADFREEIQHALSDAALVLTVIGTQWLGNLEKDSRRRIDSPNDPVRAEIEAALRSNVRIIPLLVRGGCMPSEAELPEAIKALSYRTAIDIRDDPDFHGDMGRLIASIHSLVDHNRDHPDASSDAIREKDQRSAQSRLMSYTIQEIEEQMKRRLCGQEIAIQQIIPWIKRLRFGLVRDDKAVATFIFAGQPGLGKTLLAKELARVVCGDEARLVVFEKSLLTGPTAMLVGAPPGHAGNRQGKLVKVLREAPASVLFFDEIEFVSQEVGDLLMRLCDSGFVPDATGSLCDGREALVILSTGIKADQASSKSSSGDAVQAIIKVARMRFSPDFLAPIDEIVCFVPFSRSACRQIVDLAIEREMLSVRRAQRIELIVEESARELIAEEFHKLSLSEGARSAPRVVQKLITLPVIDYAFTLQASGVDSEGKVLRVTLDDRSDIVILPATESCQSRGVGKISPLS